MRTTSRLEMEEGDATEPSSSAGYYTNTWSNNDRTPIMSKRTSNLISVQGSLREGTGSPYLEWSKKGVCLCRQASLEDPFSYIL